MDLVFNRRESSLISNGPVKPLSSPSEDDPLKTADEGIGLRRT